MFTERQIKALADARAFSGQGKTGLVRQSGKFWAVNLDYADCHAHQTICSLVDRGYLQLFVKGTIAHITDSGIRALEDAKQELVGEIRNHA